MGFFSKIADFMKPVIGFVNKAFEWISDPDNQEEVSRIIGFILTIVQTVGSLNEPIPKRDRPKTVRTLVEILQKLSPEDLREFAKIKEETDFDKMTSGDLDVRIGAIVGGFVTTEKKKKGKSA